MGKKKDQFIDKNKAITFKLSYRDNEDPFFQKQHQGAPVNVERVFEIKSIPMDDHLTAEERQKRDKLLSLFTQEDQGIFEQKQKEQQNNKFWIPPEIRKKLAGKDLWIDQLAQKSQLQEQEVEDYEVEELEEVEEIEGNEDEVEEFTEEEEEEEEEIPTEKKPVKKAQKTKEEQKQDEDDDQNADTGSEDYSYDGEDDQEDEEEQKQKEKKEDDVPQKKIEDLTSQDFPDFKYKDLVQKKIVEDNIIPKYEKLTFSKDVKFKKFNEYGLPASNFDYSKYFVQPNVKLTGQQNEGVVEAVLLANYKTAPKLKEDIDYEYEEMTEEQREVFDALNYDYDDDAYEQLEDDFVQIANDGEQAIVQDLLEEEIEEQVTGQKKKKVKGKKINFTFDEEGKIQLELEKPKTKKVVKKVIKKYTQKDSKPGKDTITEEDKQFEKAMKEMEDSYDENNYNGSSDEDYDVPELKEGILTGEGFNKILDEHIAGMSQQEREQANLEQKKSKKVNVEFEEKQKERLEKYEGYIKPEEIVTRKIYQVVPIEKDNALKSYLEREQIRETNPNYEENFDRPEAEFKLDETIATKNFSFSRVHENLTVIGGNDISLSKSKKYRPLKHADEDENKAKEKEVEQISENEEEQEEDEEDKDPLKIRSYELSKKISKGETKEEKAARKQALKEFKDARKQKKKLFKEGFEALAKEHQSKFQNRTNHHNIQNVKGISIKQMM